VFILDGNMVKNDFDTVFLACEGVDFTLSRDGSVVGPVRGIPQKKIIQFKSDADVRAGDSLYSGLQGSTFFVDKIGYELVGGIRTSLLASIHEV